MVNHGTSDPNHVFMASSASARGLTCKSAHDLIFSLEISAIMTLLGQCVSVRDAKASQPYSSTATIHSLALRISALCFTSSCQATCLQAPAL